MIKILPLLSFCLILLCSLANAQEPVDINSADAHELADQLNGIGPAKAGAIVEFRSANGPFKTLDDLLQVKGIGAKTLEKLRDRIKIGSVKASRRLAVEAKNKENQTRLTIRNIIKRANESVGDSQ